MASDHAAPSSSHALMSGASSAVQQRALSTSDEIDFRSDFTTALYALRAAGSSLPRIEIATGVPLDVKARLDASRVSFSNLSGLLQRAILWDTGYVIKHEQSSSMVEVVAIYVKCGLQMANIAPTRAYFETTGCSVQDCTQNNTTGDEMQSFIARDCPIVVNETRLSTAGVKLQALSRCAVPTVTDLSNVPFTTASTLWAVGNISTSDRYTLPQLRLLQHPSSTSSTRIYAIHSAPDEGTYASCLMAPSFIIPCIAVDQPSQTQEWCRPIQSDLIATWIRQEQDQGMALATLVLMAGAILVALALDLFVDRKPRLFVNGRVGQSMPSITSTLFDEGEEQNASLSLSERGISSIRSAEVVQPAR